MKTKPQIIQRSLFEAEDVPGQAKLFDPPLSERPDPGKPKEGSGDQPSGLGPLGLDGIDDLELLRQTVLECRRCCLRQGARGCSVRRRQPKCRNNVCRGRPGSNRRRTGKALCREGRAAPGSHAQVARVFKGRDVYRQHSQMPPAWKQASHTPRSGSVSSQSHGANPHYTPPR